MFFSLDDREQNSKSDLSKPIAVFLDLQLSVFFACEIYHHFLGLREFPAPMELERFKLVALI